MSLNSINDPKPYKYIDKYRDKSSTLGFIRMNNNKNESKYVTVMTYQITNSFPPGFKYLQALNWHMLSSGYSTILYSDIYCLRLMFGQRGFQAITVDPSNRETEEAKANKLKLSPNF